ncbi:hypothetical protein A9Y76_13245 [Ralstonia insidiosa]|uniref:Uncharacterized protein n=1 Tax=Ralstonia insidiosa TaxID=190721 RepID=A0A191ZZA0_9RALS|nr:hypothetical protein A9Y76_13245 [Ralstonia insidiosa]
MIGLCRSHALSKGDRAKVVVLVDTLAGYAQESATFRRPLQRVHTDTVKHATVENTIEAWTPRVWQEAHCLVGPYHAT